MLCNSDTNQYRSHVLCHWPFFHCIYTKNSTTESLSRSKTFAYPWQRQAPLWCSTTTHFTWSPQTKPVQMKITAVLQDLTCWSLTTGNAGEQNLFCLLIRVCTKVRALLTYTSGNQNHTSLETKWIQIFNLCKAKLHVFRNSGVS